MSVPYRALHDACVYVDFEKIKYLLEVQKVDVNERGEVDEPNVCTRTPLMHAVSCGATMECIQYLLDKGASVHLADVRNWTVLHSVCNVTGNNETIFKLLLQYGANIHVKPTARGYTLLHVAVLGSQNKYIINYLLDQGIDVHAKDMKGETALTKANDLDIVNLFLQHGASPFDVHPRLQENPYIVQAKAIYPNRVCIRMLLSLKRFPRIGTQSQLHILPAELIRALFAFLVPSASSLIRNV